MSQINFDTLLLEKPELSPVWLALREWAESPKHSRYFDPREVVVPLQRQGVPPLKLLLALQELVDRGWLVQVYRAWSPSQRIPIGEEYARPTDVPDHVRGRFDELVLVEPGNIIPLFREGT
jgi:hypothetical protein